MNGTRPNQRPNRQKATDQELLDAYAELKSISKVGLRFGMYPTSVSRRLRKLDAIDPPRRVDPNRGCSDNECLKPVYAYDMCSKHYTRAKYAGELPSFKPCQFPECNRPHYAHGYCNTHVAQLRNGNTLRPIGGPSEQERFWAKVDKDAPGGCWLWTAVKLSKGYGRFTSSAGNVVAHRYAFEELNGEIPEGMQVDHTCYNPSCVNPSHMRLLTNVDNARNRKGAPRNSTTGVRGVNWNKRAKKYIAKANAYGKGIYLGQYETIAEAEAVVVAWRRKNWPSSLKDREPRQ